MAWLAILPACLLFSSCRECKEQGEPDLYLNISYADTSQGKLVYGEIYGIGGQYSISANNENVYEHRCFSRSDSGCQSFVVPLAINAQKSSYVLVPVDETQPNDTIVFDYKREVFQDEDDEFCGYYIIISDLEMGAGTLADSLTLQYGIYYDQDE